MSEERLKIVAGNWKMHKTYREGRELALDIVERLTTTQTMVILCPPFIHLKSISTIINDITHLELGAQNCHFAEQGAYTGEVSASMLRSVGCTWVILGHSERREYFGEDEALLAKKVDAALTHGLRPIFCCGEPLEVREAAQHIEWVQRQLEGALFHLEADEFARLVIAYEPIWAIGTGKTATPQQAQEMHAAIRQMVADKYGAQVAHKLSILYGGSVKPNNAKELFAQPDVDGGLIGGASLRAEDFVTIVKSF